MKTIRLKDLDVPYVIIRKRSNRRMYIRIKDGVLTITCPYLFAESKCLKLIFENEEYYYKWYVKNINKQSKTLNDNQIIRIFNHDYVIHFSSRSYKDGNTLYVREDHKNYDLLMFFYEDFIKIMESLTKQYYEIMFNNNDYPKIVFKQVKGYFGECFTKQRKIVYNLYCIFNSIECYEYLVVHELAHLKYASHDKSFHNLVEKYCPNHLKYRNQLHKEGIIIW